MLDNLRRLGIEEVRNEEMGAVFYRQKEFKKH